MQETRLSRRRVVATSAIGLTTVLAGCSDGGGGGADHTVTVGPGGATEFDPAELTVSTGDTVRFEWDSPSHNVNPNPQNQPDGADWGGEEEISDEGHTHEHTFDVAGTYEYQCDPHVSSGMTGTITVED